MNTRSIKSMFKETWDAVALSVYNNAKTKGFWDDGLEKRNKAEMIALMHSELSEALEYVRKGGKDDHLPDRDGVEVELADTIIRIMDYGHAFDLDIAGAIFDKMDYNSNRPYKHGKRF